MIGPFRLYRERKYPFSVRFLVPVFSEEKRTECQPFVLKGNVITFSDKGEL